MEMSKVKFDTADEWRRAIQDLMWMGADFASGNIEDRTITIYHVPEEKKDDV